VKKLVGFFITLFFAFFIFWSRDEESAITRAPAMASKRQEIKIPEAQAETTVNAKPISKSQTDWASDVEVENPRLDIQGSSYIWREDLRWVKASELSSSESERVLQKRAHFRLMNVRDLEPTRGSPVVEREDSGTFALVTGTLKMRNLTDAQKSEILSTGKYELKQDYPQLKLVLLTAKESGQMLSNYQELRRDFGVQVDLEVLVTFRESR
jgi:hypothetical protein